MDKAIYASTWDLVDESLDQVLERIRATGFNAITLAASQPAGPFSRAQAPTDQTRSRADGTIYFRARPERYGHIKPRVHPLVSECDGLAELQRAAPDLGRAAYIADPHHAPIGASPDNVSCNAFGEPYPHRLCPAHPAVRDYVVNLCSDVARGYDLAAVVLEASGWLPCDQGYHPEFAAAPLDRWARTLLSFCFADTTRHAAQAAGIDADRLQARARELLERYRSAHGVPNGMAAAWWFADALSDPEWAAFLDWRCRQVADLVTDVRAALPAGTALVVIPTVPYGAAARLAGNDIGMLSGAADALEVPAYEASADDLDLLGRDLRRRAGDDAALRFILRPGHPDLGGGMEIRRAVLELQQIGITGIAFYDYNHIRQGGLGAVKAALEALESP